MNGCIVAALSFINPGDLQVQPYLLTQLLQHPVRKGSFPFQ